jgi:hypothetical protein
MKQKYILTAWYCFYIETLIKLGLEIKCYGVTQS